MNGPKNKNYPEPQNPKKNLFKYVTVGYTHRAEWIYFVHFYLFIIGHFCIQFYVKCIVKTQWQLGGLERFYFKI